jgi:glycine oxidase
MAAGTSSSGANDVIIVGGGLIGCAIALRLAQNKTRVTVFERTEPGCEASSAGAGMIAPQGETLDPDAFYDLCAASRDLYPEFVAEIEDASGQSVNFVHRGSLMVAADEPGRVELKRIYDRQTSAGLPLQRLSAEEAHRACPGLSPEILEAVVVPGDHWLDNEALARSLHAACLSAGVIFRLHTVVNRFVAHKNRVEAIEAVADGQPAPSYHSAAAFVLAAGAWSGHAVASLELHLPVVPCRGQMIELDGAGDFPVTVRAGHYYIVPRSNGRIVAGSTMEYVGYDKQVTGEGLLSILHGVSTFVSVLKQWRFRRAWAGLRPDTKDHRPVLGLGRFENLIFATGHFRNGILLTPVTARLISDLLLSGSTSFPIDDYSPARFGC